MLEMIQLIFYGCTIRVPILRSSSSSCRHHGITTTKKTLTITTATTATATTTTAAASNRLPPPPSRRSRQQRSSKRVILDSYYYNYHHSLYYYYGYYYYYYYIAVVLMMMMMILGSSSTHGSRNLSCRGGSYVTAFSTTAHYRLPQQRQLLRLLRRRTTLSPPPPIVFVASYSSSSSYMHTTATATTLRTVHHRWGGRGVRRSSDTTTKSSSSSDTTDMGADLPGVDDHHRSDDNNNNINISTSTTTDNNGNNGNNLKLSYESQLMDAKRNLEQVVTPFYLDMVKSYPYTKAQLQQMIRDYEHEQSAPDFWSDTVRTATVHTQLSEVTRLWQRLEQWESWYGDATAALDMLLEDNNQSPSTSSSSTTSSSSSISKDERDLLLDELLTATRQLQRDCDQAEIEFLLSGPYDDCPARMVITAGAGGIEAMDWVADLTRMYTRYCERQYGYGSVTKIDWNDSFSGYKSMELLIRGPKAYGYLQGEKGSHRLVRVSPYNAMGKRQTTFAGVDVTPELPPSLLGTLNDIQIPEAELEVTTMRSPGKGGQHVNKVSSGVRMKHLPSGISVRCTEERSQLANRNIAMHRLKTQLLLIAQEQHVQTIKEIRGDIIDATWGTQIRSYILQPYRLVKDTRTGWETTQTQDILNGDELLDDCIHTYLRHKANKERQEANNAALEQ